RDFGLIPTDEPSVLGKLFNLFSGATPAPPAALPEPALLEPAAPEPAVEVPAAEIPDADIPDAEPPAEQADSTADEISPPETDENSPAKSSAAIDDWLLKNRQVDGRTDWLAGAVEPLRKMLDADATDEQFAAARALVAIGDERAAEVMQELAI